MSDNITPAPVPKDKIPQHPPQIAIMIDESGSMGILWDDTITAVNAYIAHVKGRAEYVEFTLGIYQHAIKWTYDAAPLEDVKPITRADYAPGGGNEILKSTSALIDKLERRVGTGKARVVVVLQTDGGEGSGGEAYWAPLKRRIAAKEKDGWVFILMFAQSTDPRMIREWERIAADKTVLEETRKHYRDAIANTKNNPLAGWLGIKPAHSILYGNGAAPDGHSMQAFAAAADKTLAELG